MTLNIIALACSEEKFHF